MELVNSAPIEGNERNFNCSSLAYPHKFPSQTFTSFVFFILNLYISLEHPQMTVRHIHISINDYKSKEDSYFVVFLLTQETVILNEIRTIEECLRKAFLSNEQGLGFICLSYAYRDYWFNFIKFIII